MLKSSIPSEDKYDLAISFDEVLGLRLEQEIPNSTAKRVMQFQIPAELKKMVYEREKLRKEGKWEEADKLRKEVETKGFTIEDIPQGSRLIPVKKLY